MTPAVLLLTSAKSSIMSRRYWSIIFDGFSILSIKAFMFALMISENLSSIAISVSSLWVRVFLGFVFCLRSRAGIDLLRDIGIIFFREFFRLGVAECIQRSLQNVFGLLRFQILLFFGMTPP